MRSYQHPTHWYYTDWHGAVQIRIKPTLGDTRADVVEVSVANHDRGVIAKCKT